MSGHGHVIPNANGLKARCGGPALCSACALELARAMVPVREAGWVLVPIEPTPEMVVAGCPHTGVHDATVRKIWRQMIEARPRDGAGSVTP